jgi:hypothetical protein
LELVNDVPEETGEVVDRVRIGLHRARAAEAGTVDRERLAADGGESRDGDVEERSVAGVPERVPEDERHAAFESP